MNNDMRKCAKRTNESGSNSNKVKTGYKNRHKRTEAVRSFEDEFPEYFGPQVKQQHDMLLAEIVRCPLDREGKLKIMRSICFIYSLDDKYALDFYNAFKDEHVKSSEEQNARETEIAYQMIIDGMTVLSQFAGSNPMAVKRVEATIVAAWSIFRNRNDMSSVVLSIVQYIQAITTGPIMIPLVQCLRELFVTSQEQGLGSLFGDTSTEYTSVFKNITSSAFYSHAKVISTVLCTIGLVDPGMWSIRGFEVFCMEAFDHKKITLLEVVDTTLGSIAFFFERGYKCFVEKSYRPLFVVSDRLMALEVAVEELSIRVRNHVQGSDRQDFATLNGDIYKLADDLRSASLSVKPIEAVTVRRLVKMVMNMENDVVMAFKSETMRVAPFCYKIWGTSGVGKTSFNLIAMREILRFNGYKYEDVNINKIEPEKEYWENIQNDTTGITIDDMCNTIHTKEKVNPADILIKVVNNQPQSVNRAELADKGKIWLDAKVVGITTNNRTLAAEHWSVEPMSIVRRCHLHIDLKVKSQYADQNGQLDAEKVAEHRINGYVQDIWDISVFEVRRKPSSKLANMADDYELAYASDELGEMKLVGMERFLCYVYDKTKKYYAQQEAFINGQKLSNNLVTCCDRCNRITQYCYCPVIPVKPEEKKALPPGSKEQSFSMFLYDTFFLNSMSFVNAGMIAFVYKWIFGPHGSYMLAKTLSFFQSVLFPTSWETMVIKQLCAQKSNVYISSSISLINHFIDWHYVHMPSFVTNSQLSTYFYMYWYRHSVYKTFKTSLVYAYMVVCFTIIAQGWYYDSFIIHNYIWYILFSLIFILLMLYIYNYIYGVRHSKTYPVELCIGIGAIQLVLAYSYAESPALSRTCILCFLFYSFAYACLNTLCTYMRVFTRLQQLRSIGKKAKYNLWTYDMMCGSPRDFFSVTGIVHNLAVIVLIVNTVRLVRSGIAIFNITEKKKEEDQGGVLSPTTVVEAEKREAKVNIWAHTIQNKTKTSRTSDDFVNTIKKNLLAIKITSATTVKGASEKSLYCNALMLRGKVVMFPLHMVYERLNGDWTIPFLTFKAEFIRSETVNSGWKEEFDFKNGRVIPGHDLIVFPTHGGGPFADIVPLFDQKTNYCGFVHAVKRALDGRVEVRNGKVQKHEMMLYSRGDISMNWQGVHVKLNNSEWNNGDCISVITTIDSSPSIIGLHLIGTGENSVGISVNVSQPQLQSVLHSLPDIYVTHAVQEIPAQIYDVDIGLNEEIHHKSPVNFIEHRNLSVLGSVTGGRTMKSKVRPSIAVPYLEPILGPQRFGPPPIKGSDGRSSWEPWYTNLNGTSQVCTTIPSAELEIAVADYEQGLHNIIRLHRVKITPLDEETNINGMADSRFMTGLNRDTSMGYPLGKAKSNYMELIRLEPNGRKIFAFNDNRVWTRWYTMEEELAQGKIPTTVFKATLKDEPTKIGKNKVRVFQAADIGMQLGVRKYFLPIIRALCLHPLLSECAVGINPFSLEWDALDKHVSKFGRTRIIAGDYKGWDTTLPAVLVHRSMLVLIHLAQITGNYTDRDITVMKGIAAVLCSPTINFNGTLIRLHGTTPSGHNLTSVLNSISNSLLLRCAFYRYNDLQPLCFRNYISNITYGDDFKAGVSSETTFNLVYYEQYLRTYTGIVVTMPDKTSTIVPYLNYDDVDFLKRKSVFLEDLGVRIGVLDIMSVHKSLYTTMSDIGDEKNVLISVVHSALHECFYHGRETYDRYVSIFRGMFSYLDLDPGDIYSTYDERVKKWKESYVVTAVLDDGRVDDTLAAGKFEGLADTTDAGDF